MFQRLGIDVQQVMIDQPTALQKLQSGEIDAIARVIPKPVEFFSKIPPNSGLHLVNIPFTKMFEDHYTLGEFTKQDYPNLLEGNDRIDTIAVPAVLAVYNWPIKTERYLKVQRFVQYLFNNFSKLQHPPYHPKWRDVNLAATVPGWTRFSVAQDMLDKIRITGRVHAAAGRLQLLFEPTATYAWKRRGAAGLVSRFSQMAGGAAGCSSAPKKIAGPVN